jgi:predicted DNA-binding WGR domain protein
MSDLAVKALHNRNPGHDKFYVCRVDYVGGVKPYRVVAAWGAVGRPKAQAEQTKGEFTSVGQARIVMSRLIDEKTKKGYVDVESNAYSNSRRAGSYPKAALLAKVDMTRCCFDDGSVNVASVSTYAAPLVSRITKPTEPEVPSKARKIIRGLRKDVRCRKLPCESARAALSEPSTPTGTTSWAFTGAQRQHEPATSNRSRAAPWLAGGTST